ncbi:MAG TPA: DUF4232 domain-containing protein, partial [Candidatus Deferrimicrobium sp.]|nr:DUF4232 domain-containing protein [Candidatus Deferrimicrobium sp.]
DDLIAWNTGTPPPSVATPSPGSVVVAPCSSDQLEAGRLVFGGAGGSQAGGFVLRNTAAVACGLDGRPAITIVDPTGHALRLRTVPDDQPARLVVLEPGLPLPADGAEAPAGLGGLFLVWGNWCGGVPNGPLRLVVSLSDGGRLVLPFTPTSLPRCDEPTAASTISVGPFEATSGPDPTDPPPIPAESLRLSLLVPDQAVAGEVLTYVAILANPTAAPIDLRPCPAFIERLNTLGGPVVVRHLLACDIVPVIAAGDQVRFAMEIDLPATLPADPVAALVWSLDPYGAEGFPPRPPEAKVAMPVVAATGG